MKRKLLSFLFAVFAAGYMCSAQVVFDPATYSGAMPAGMSIVNVDGTDYLQVILNGWSSSLPLDPVVIKRSTSFTCEAKYAVGTSGVEITSINTFLKLANSNFSVEIGAAGAASSSSFISYSVNITHQDTIANLQVAGQETGNGWPALVGDTLWVGKVTVLPSFERVITMETFGTLAFDTDAPVKSRGFAKHYYWTEVTDFSSLNGHIEGGDDSSVRITNYGDLGDRAVATNWRGTPSGPMNIHMAKRPSYSGSWDTLRYVGIDIQGYKANSLEFGYGRARTLTTKDSVVTNVMYSLDGGAWTQLDTSIIDTNGYQKWAYITLPLGGIEGETLDILFAALKTDQFYMDDIAVVGDIVIADSIQLFTSEDTITTVNGTAQLTDIVYPANARQALTWSVNSPIATIDDNGLLTALSNGTIIVTGTAVDGLSASLPIVIYGQKPSPMPIAVNVFGSADNAADYTGTVAIGWEADSVYMEFVVTDDSIVNSGAIYQVDNIEIYFDLDNSKNIHWPRGGNWIANPDPSYDENDMQLRVRPGIDGMLDVASAEFPSKVIYNANDTGYVFNIKIAWNDLLAGYTPTPGDQIGFDIDLSDNDAVSSDANRNQFTWVSPTDKLFNDPSLWGTLEVIQGGAFLPVADVEAPTAPVLTGVSGDLSAILTWTPSTDNTSVMSYIVKQGIFNVDTITAKQTGNALTINNLQVKNYGFNIMAVDNHGNKSVWSNSVYIDIKDLSGIDVLSAAQFAIYPNPVINELNIDNASSIVMVEVLGINGGVINSVANSSAEQIRINTSDLANGMYFIRMTTTDGNVVMSKFIKE
jgi:hypothetical protein